MLAALPPDVLMLLMTDVLLFLQEKDQKYIFPALVRSSSSSFLSTDKCHGFFLLFCPSQKGPENPPESRGYDCNRYYNIVRDKNS